MIYKSYVTGAAGFVGSSLVSELLRRRHRVTAFIRPGHNIRFSGSIPADGQLRVIEGDLCKADTICDISGSDYVFHLGASLRGLSGNDYYNSNTRGTVNLLCRLKLECSDLKRFVFLSSIAAAGPALRGVPLDEAAEPSPVSHYGKSKLLAEQAVLKFHSPQFPVTILRSSSIIGPNSHDLIRVVIELAQLGLGIKLRGDPPKLSVVYVDDLVEAICGAAMSTNTIGNTYFVGHDVVEDANELLAKAAESIGGRRFATLPLDRKSQYIFAVMCELYSLVTRTRPPFTRDKWREITEGDWTCSSARAKADFGWEAQTTVAEMLTKIIEIRRQNRRT
ncbi:NAD-dependent epimerase/dehydratase family protein [Rhizobium ruizarguesonis]